MALCVAAGVQYGANEESLAPMAALTDNKVYGMKGVTRMNPAVQSPNLDLGLPSLLLWLSIWKGWKGK